jgi:hypothetical protein
VETETEQTEQKENQNNNNVIKKISIKQPTIFLENNQQTEKLTVLLQPPQLGGKMEQKLHSCKAGKSFV